MSDRRAQEGRLRRAVRQYLTHSETPLLQAEAIREEAARTTARNGQLLAATVAASHLLFWPTDPWIFPSAEAVALVAQARAGTVATCLLGLALLSFGPVSRRWSSQVLAVLLCATNGIGAAAFGQVGGLEQPLFFISYATVPLSALLLLPVGARLAVNLGAAAAWCAGYFGPNPQHLASPWAPMAIVFLVFVVLFTTVLGHVIYHLWRTGTVQRAQLREQAVALEEERARAEALLLNVLPAPVAERLKRGEQPIADAASEVTVLFADICGFTPLAQQVPAAELVAFLNRLFSAFDEKVAAHGLEKIKTLGDAYMVAGGLPSPRADHAAAVARLALDLMDVAGAERLPGGAPVRIRVGIHSGPVVAGVIGQRKFAYDLWGDTVNVASRLESHGVPGEIQLSAATRERLGDAFVLEPRGEVDLKGRGPTEVWLLRGLAAGARRTG